jgi:hypothetical protein
MSTVKQFIEEFQEKKIQNTKVKENAVSDYLKESLDIKTYLPFRLKRQIVETVVAQNTEWVDGVKRNDAINQYIGFVVAMIGAHTNLEFSDDPVADYDLLSESGLLPQIITEFSESYNECDILLKMALAMELEDNNINIQVGKLLNKLSTKLDDVGDIIKSIIEDFDLKDILGDFKQEDLAKLKGFLNKFN